ncbi:MAG TPA: class II fructose-bisphosphate aldolase [Pyrinomonadaceae bacterium]|jgi:tagatose 1,6-diphosphate aldolase GatY/KbaY
MSSLSPSRPILENAQRSGVAIAALNFYNAETILAHVAAAKTQKASIILQTTESTINYLGLRMILAMANAAAEEIERPVALHLDHGGSYDLAARCIEQGYTSVMIDGSKLPFGENCELTRKVVDLAHDANVSVEGELGHVRHNDEIGTADNGEFFTRPDDARKFVEETGVDSLAVAVGTAHGFYKGEVKLDFERLKQIKSVTGSTSLVLHGGSGVPDELLQKAIRCGISKINFGTELKNAFTRAVKKSLLETNDIDLRRTFAPAIAAVREVSLQKIRLCQELDGVR